MTKRPGHREDSPYSKRRKLSRNGRDASVQTTPEEIHSWKDLQRLLAFDQLAGAQARPKIQRFKKFLDLTAYSEDAGEKATKRSLLHEYLDQQRSQSNGGLADLIRSWSFAAQSNDERLFSAIAAVLALFLKTTSTYLEFREYGNQLCQALLEESPFRLFERGLSAAKAKEHIISPCLRLLTEIVAYDGGAAAKHIWRRRDIAFLRVEMLLTIRKEKADDLEQSPRKPSVRDNALRYLFANLRLQSPTAKAGMLTLAHGKLARAIFQGLDEDSPATLIELLSTIKRYVVTDIDLPHHIKKGLFREETLARIAALYKHKEDPDATEPTLSVRQNAHSLLLTLCASPDSGLLEASRGSQARGMYLGDYEPDGSPQLNGGPYGDSSSWGPMKHSRVLSRFLQGLRPHANLLEEKLVIAVFKTAPDMLAEYFQRKKSFSLEPKLTATWIGFSKFLISVIRLPIPVEYMQSPGFESKSFTLPVNNLMESILPSPLSRKTLTRSMNQSIDLVTFFAIRIMIVAFQKLEVLVKSFSNGHENENGALSSKAPGPQTIAHLVDEFRSRCPEVRHVITGFRSSYYREKPMLREAFSRLLVYYYRLIPQCALEEKFDISITLSNAFLGCRTLSDSTLHTLELQHLLEIARRSPDMHWWYKSGTQ